MAEDDLRGSFSGIGIEFTIRQDTVRVQNVIKNGPSERAGVQAGDRIVTVDDSLFVGPTIDNEKAIRTLKGPKDTKVKLGVLRYGEQELRHITVTRGEIPMHSVTAAYMLNDDTGYLRIKNFGENTYPELLIGLAQLAQEGFQQLVIDLRGNTGGYLEASVQIANEFLPKNRLIVYTEGRHSPRQDHYSDGRGSYQKMPLVVLIDAGSASAAEILAGAIQDNDRGTIVGRRSFGKGLVQKPIEFNDGSLMRLTIARYYTPSGRCIQKPYTSGQNKDYEDDLVQRYEHGEYFSGDSIRHTGPAYKTVGGHEVYGGGGITPDIFVAEDTTDYTSYYKEAAMSGMLLQYGYEYVDRYRRQLEGLDDVASLVTHLKKQHVVDKFATWADTHGLRRRNLLIQRSQRLLEQYLVGRIVYGMLDERAFIEYQNASDPTVNEAIRVLKDGEAFPKKKE
jgi:carboxyl-terminal processing protease